MYDSWTRFYNSGSTYSYLEYKESQKRKRELRTQESGTNLKK